MNLLGVVGADVDPRPAVDRLARRLDGPVATVHRGEVDRSPEAATARYDLDEDGTWTATGTDRSVDALLDDLAPGYDYAVLVGFPDPDVPQVVFGDSDSEADVVARFPTVEDLDVERIVDEIDTRDPFETLPSLVERAKASPKAPRAGAIATFTGRVRAKEGPDDDPTKHLEFERYDEVAVERMTDIERELCERDGVHEVVLHHRTGVVEYGEDIVFVVVLAGHREEAFRTVRDGINRLKDEVPLFKREVTVEEEFWVHDRE